MIQRVLTFLILAWLLSAELALAAPALKTVIKKSPEAAFVEGLACLKQQDIACAQLAASMIPSPSPYAKLLAGNMAVAEADFDRAFRLLLPLQAATGLTPEANASLHTSLARAYENQSDALRALEQHVLAEANLSVAAELETNQQRLWQLLAALPKDQLVEMRGESEDTLIQGWIDLALAFTDNEPATSAWRKAYADHPANRLLARLAAKTALSADAKTELNTIQTSNSTGSIALILPQNAELSDAAIDAVRNGFLMAQSVANSQTEIRIFTAQGKPDDTYALTMQEGVHYIVDLAPHEQPADSKAAFEFVTLHPPMAEPMANTHSTAEPPAKVQVLKFGFSPQAEAEQLVKIARNYGMQTATIVSAESALSERWARAFNQAWIAAGGQVKLRVSLLADTNLSDIKAQITAHPADMIVLAASTEEARAIRPYLDLSTPTFGFSSSYSGTPHQTLDAPLFAMRFVDIPWLLKPDESAFEPYRAAAENLPAGEAQRWYALGVDAYLLLAKLIQNPGKTLTLNGLSGKIQVNDDGQISRELSLGIFSKEGVMLEPMP